MNRAFALVTGIGATAALAACGVPGVDLDGVDSTEVRAVEAFTSIELRGAADVVVIVGGSQQVEITTDRAAQDKVDTYVSDGELIINTSDGWNWGALDVDVAISVPSLTGFDLSGAGDIVIRGIDGEEFVLHVDGAGDVQLEGAADYVLVSLDGAGDIDARQLVGADVVARLAGAGDITVNATNTLDAQIDGVGSIDYVGTPRVTKSVDGVGNVGPA